MAAESQGGALSITVRDGATQTIVPCRIHLFDSGGDAVKVEGYPAFRDHFVCTGAVHALALPVGAYRYEIERGPEWSQAAGTVYISAESTYELDVALQRLVNLPEEGWWPGELHIHRALEDLELLMMAEDLHVGPAISWWNAKNLWDGKPLPDAPLRQFDGNRYTHLLGGEDERGGGAFMYFNMDRPLGITGAEREYPSAIAYVEEARDVAGAWVDAEKPFWWDVPIALACSRVDSIGIANNHMCRSWVLADEAWGHTRDLGKYPGVHGNARWSQDIYYHVLNCGLRVPPSAGSASGVLPNPVGYNRAYVYIDGDLTYAKWWEGLAAGRSFVTNGPLLRVRAGGQLPGHVFGSPDGEPVALALTAELDGRDSIKEFEIIKNGEVHRVVPYSEWKKNGDLGTVQFGRSGWFLIRVIAENDVTFRFASTAPYYVDVGQNTTRISRASAQFFLDWTETRANRISIDDAGQYRAVMQYHDQARAYWQRKLSVANAD
jgi:hypothetical protein